MNQATEARLEEYKKHEEMKAQTLASASDYEREAFFAEVRGTVTEPREEYRVVFHTCEKCLRLGRFPECQDASASSCPEFIGAARTLKG